MYVKFVVQEFQTYRKEIRNVEKQMIRADT